jgi:ribosomal protein S18 acetylase RimI-like enzyme
MQSVLMDLLCDKDPKKYGIFKEIESAHYRNQVGVYFSKIDRIDGAIFLSSEIIKDHYWNYATQIDVSPSQLKKLIESIKFFFLKKNRSPSIYISPFTKPKIISQVLEKHGFSPVLKDAWMVFNSDTYIPRKINNYTIRKVKNLEDMEIFIKIFYEAYGGASQDEPYGALPPEYGQALRYSFNNPKRGVTVIHYIGFTNNDPVGISTLIYSQGYAGIYNVGTSSKYRNMGIGTYMSQVAISEARKQKNSIIYLMTEFGSYVEKFYQKIGFSTKFIGIGYLFNDRNEDLKSYVDETVQ